jgi:hypothetical protein
MIVSKNTTRVALRNYFKMTNVNRYTATMPIATDFDYGLSNVILEFSNSATKTIDVTLNFLFEEPANDFHLKNNIVLAGDLTLDDLPLNTGTAISTSYVFSDEKSFLSFYQNFLADNNLEIEFK